MEGTPDHMGDLFSDPDLWPNQSFLSNETDANASSVFSISPVMHKIINISMVVMQFIGMTSLGCTVDLSRLKHHMMKPKGVAIALAAQYGIMPFTAFCFAKAFQLTDITAVVVLVYGCCPGGVISNFLTLTLQGDINLSIVMTTMSTFMAVGMMPLLLYVYCQGFDLVSSVPYVNITIALVMILIPCSTGILINHYRSQYSKTIKKAGFCFMMFGVFAIGIITSIAIGSSILTVLSSPLMTIGALMPLVGFAFGYIVSSLFRLNQPERRTIAMETGCQNSQLCFTILKLAFPPERVGPLFLFPMVYMAFQLMEVLLLIVLFRCHQRFTRKGKEAYQPAITEDPEGTV